MERGNLTPPHTHKVPHRYTRECPAPLPPCLPPKLAHRPEGAVPAEAPPMGWLLGAAGGLGADEGGWLLGTGGALGADDGGWVPGPGGCLGPDEGGADAPDDEAEPRPCAPGGAHCPSLARPPGCNAPSCCCSACLSARRPDPDVARCSSHRPSVGPMSGWPMMIMNGGRGGGRGVTCCPSQALCCWRPKGGLQRSHHTERQARRGRQAR